MPCSLSASELRLAAALLPREHVVRFDFVDGHVALAHRLVVGMPRLGAFFARVFSSLYSKYGENESPCCCAVIKMPGMISCFCAIATGKGAPAA